MDALIQHMSAAKDMDQARHRGQDFLAAFERAITEHARSPVSPCPAVPHRAQHPAILHSGVCWMAG